MDKGQIVGVDNGEQATVNATKRRKMAHGNVGPLTAKGCDCQIN